MLLQYECHFNRKTKTKSQVIDNQIVVIISEIQTNICLSVDYDFQVKV